VELQDIGVRFQDILEEVGIKMIGDIVIQRDIEGRIGIGVSHPAFGFTPVLIFHGWGKFRKFIDSLEEYYSKYYPRIPTAFIEAFSEGKGENI